jgi:plastocyanin
MAETHNVAIKGPPFAFDPNSLTIKAGDIVAWTNQTSAPHTVTADNGDFDSGRLSGTSYFVTTQATDFAQ